MLTSEGRMHNDYAIATVCYTCVGYLNTASDALAGFGNKI